MKKTYINPTLEVVEIEIKNQLLAGSDPVLGAEYNSSTDGDPLGRELGDEFDFDE